MVPDTFEVFGCRKVDVLEGWSVTEDFKTLARPLGPGTMGSPVQGTAFADQLWNEQSYS